MDETRKAASVGQLQELNKTVAASIEKASTESAAAVGAVASRLIALENKIDACAQMCQQMMAEEPDPVDLSPVIAVIQAQGEAQMAVLKQLLEMIARPLTRTGEARLPDGGLIQLQVSETRN